ncbi:MAG TPA: cytochrome c maturation protein CcmE [Pseudomonadota bacterium]|nr:cytochrome c maturation protein CcmE [Xanthomonadales bacterium]HQW63814.1 cytochrome c maturation protein CcmE [Pseudomonadota bacterium]
MNPTRRRRLWLVVLVVFAVAGATALAMTALRQNIQHFYSPTELTEGKAPPERRFRLGGVVAEGSTERASDSLEVRFVVTDRFKETPVVYVGILPDLFREGQSVVTTGTLRADGTFVATEVLAKHDENYMPSEVAEAIAKAKAKSDAAAQPGSG